VLTWFNDSTDQLKLLVIKQIFTYSVLIIEGEPKGRFKPTVRRNKGHRDCVELKARAAFLFLRDLDRRINFAFPGTEDVF
jgi:hypothetical protein